MNKFVVNLDRCKDRMKYFDKSYTRWSAVDGAVLKDDNPVLSKMISMYNISPQQHRAKCGCFISHINLLQHIINNKLNNVLVLEDDAEMVNPLPDPLPEEFTYLGGFFSGKHFSDVEVPHRAGIWDIPENTKLLMTLSYYIPQWEAAKFIYDEIMSQKRYRAIDVMLNNIHFTKCYHYPACYIERPLVSTIRDDKVKHSTKYYTWERKKDIFKIAIPSYQRYDKLCKFTLDYLDKHGIKNDIIYIFIRNDDKDFDKYKSLEEHGYHVVSTDVKGIGATHNFITDYFKKDEFIIEIDDDLKKVVDNQRKDILSFTDTFETIIHKMNVEDVSYAGLYSVPNPMFMSGCAEYTNDLRYMLGILRIRRIRKDIILETNYSEDFENIILHYIRDGKLLKCNWLAGVTNNYSSGGCDGDGRSVETEKKDKEHLAVKYPEHCKIFQRKNGRYDLRLKDRK